jgi:hypothetical protein
VMRLPVVQPRVRHMARSADVERTA